FARLCPDFQVQYLGANLWPSELKENGLNGIDMNQFYYLPVARFHDEARELGMSINVWTVNKEKDMEQVVATGIDLLTTDEPMKAREMLQEREERR
ncbi:MAG: glycerophosphodiester phosphodiesterase, partial [Paludibacteraceae bacterium]|nr:glycerophosphodiester phosphodiesterase [Paludibacteraceae bacterium]